MSLILKQIIDILDRIAPPKLAESWDNIGLQVGGLDWKVDKIWVALDPMLETVENACRENVDLLITHHPLFFKKISRIDINTVKGKIVNLALKNRLSIFCLHTNFDIVSGGINDILANKIGLNNVRVLSKNFRKNLLYKLVVFAPMSSEKAILKSIFSTKVGGKIGNYSYCSFRNDGIGTFLPGDKSKPYIGVHRLLSEVKEIRIEIVIDKKDLEKVITSIKKVHPYEKIPYDIYPLISEKKSGIGRIGNLKKIINLKKFIKKIKLALDLDTIKVSGNLDMLVKSVVVCSGSGSGFINDFFKSKAQVYVSSDISYHHARDAEDLGLAIIDIGHFHSEQVGIENLTVNIKKRIKEIDKNISIYKATTENDVFNFI